MRICATCDAAHVPLGLVDEDAMSACPNELAALELGPRRLNFGGSIKSTWHSKF